MKKHFAITIILLAFLAINTFSLEKVSIAVLDFEGNNVEPTLCQAMSDVMRTVLVNSGRFTVTERDKIGSIMKEQAFQQSGVTAKEKAVRLGQMLNVQKLIFGSISLTGNTFLVNVSLVDVQKAEIETGELQKYTGQEDFLAEQVEIVTKKLIQKIPLMGNVIKVEGTSIIADIGSKQGIEPGFLLKITRKIDNVTDLEGRIIGIMEMDITEGQVVMVGENWCKLELSEDMAVNLGDYVRLSLDTQKERPKKLEPVKDKKENNKEKDKEKKADEPVVPTVF